MYPNFYVCEANAAQLRQERLSEAAVERSLRAAHREQDQEREWVVRRRNAPRMHRAWKVFQGYVASLLW